MGRRGGGNRGGGGEEEEKGQRGGGGKDEGEEEEEGEGRRGGWRGYSLQRTHKYLTGFLVRSLRPFNLVNDQGLKNFVQAIAPQYRLPTTRTINKYMGAMYDQCV